MTVRKAAGTSVSLAVLIVGAILLLPVIKKLLPNEITEIIARRTPNPSSIAGFYTLVVKAGVWMVILAGALDAIMQKRVAMGLLASLNIPLVMCIPVIIAGTIPQLGLYLFWAITQATVMAGAYWAFRKVMRNNRLGGQKLVPFIKEIKELGGMQGGHISDHFVIWGASLLLLAFCALSIVSLLVYIAVNWYRFI